MKIELSKTEQRVIGCLIEKSITTPEIYPLSLNSLTNACNQKSNREPVMDLAEAEVQQVVDGLINKHLVTRQFATSNRVVKFQHRFCNTEFSDLRLSAQELGVICVLFLRGAQTPGEIRTRTNRLCEFANVAETEAVLDAMLERDSGALVQRLPREPGRRECRYRHCFGDPGETCESIEEQDLIAPVNAADERITELESKMALLEEKIEVLTELLRHK